MTPESTRFYLYWRYMGLSPWLSYLIENYPTSRSCLSPWLIWPANCGLYASSDCLFIITYLCPYLSPVRQSDRVGPMGPRNFERMYRSQSSERMHSPLPIPWNHAHGDLSTRFASPTTISDWPIPRGVKSGAITLKVNKGFPILFYRERFPPTL